jgi:5-methylcytosine-specific restriction endonuclease McrA
MTAFDVGHVIAEKNGGTATIVNLRPICSSCNTSMGTRDMRDYVISYGYLIG